MSDSPADNPFLFLRDAQGAEQVVELTVERLTVGRDPENDLALTWDPEASRLHAVVERVGRSWTVLDDKISRNGTFVNGVRLHGRRRLEDHDLVHFGATEVVFRDPSGTSVETAPASRRVKAAKVSEAQRQVLVALCRPLADPREGGVAASNREIAEELVISVETVRSRMKTLFELFELPDLPQNLKRAELAELALAKGVVLPKDLAG